MTLAQRKLGLIQNLLLIQDNSILQEVEKVINQNGANPTEQSFEEWNAQFDNAGMKMDDYVEEYGMTLGELRKEIWEAKKESETHGISYDEFMTKLKSW
jgi:predicted SpoU family rRNA methylase